MHRARRILEDLGLSPYALARRQGPAAFVDAIRRGWQPGTRRPTYGGEPAISRQTSKSCAEPQAVVAPTPVWCSGGVADGGVESGVGVGEADGDDRAVLQRV